MIKPALLEKVHWLGHASIVLDMSRRIYIDPFRLAEYPPKADLVLITHSHWDHFSPKDMQMILNEQTWIVAPDDCAIDFHPHVLQVAVGQEHNPLGVRIRTVPAYNISKNYHPKSPQKLGYLVDIDGLTFYHAGDTDFIPEMEGLRCNVAFIPVGGTYTMDTKEAEKAVRAIDCDIVVPMHWGTLVGNEAEVRQLAKAFPDKVTMLPTTRF